MSYFVLGLDFSKNFMHATNTGESFLNPILWVRFFMLELFPCCVCCCCCSGDAFENFFGVSILLNGIELPRAFVNVASRVFVDFFLVSLMLYGVGCFFLDLTVWEREPSLFVFCEH